MRPPPRQSQDCLRERSLSDPRLCIKAARLGGRVIRHGWHVCALRFSAPLRSRPARLVRLGLRNPSAATGCLAWSEYLPAPYTAVSAASCASSRTRALPFASALPRPLSAVGTCSIDTAQAFPLAPTDEPPMSNAHRWPTVLRPSRCPTMCLWHAERVSATNQSERGERRGCALRGTPGEAAAFRCVRPLIAKGDHVPTGR